MVEGVLDRGQYRDDLKGSLGWILLGGALSLLVLYAAFELLTAVVFGLFFYYGTRPIFHWLRQYGWGRKTSAFVALTAVALPVLVVMVMFVITAINQASYLVQQVDLGAMEPLLRNLDVYVLLESIPSSSLGEVLTSEGFTTIVATYWSMVSGLANTVISFVFTVLLSFLAAFFMFVWGGRFVTDMKDVFRETDGVLDVYLDRLDTDLATIFFGNIVNAIVTSIIGVVCFVVLNMVYAGPVTVPVPILLGLLTGIASFVPLFGSKIVYVPVTAVMLFQSYAVDAPFGFGFALVFLAVSAIIVDLLPDMVLRPFFSGRSTSQAALFLSYIVGPIVFGVVGFFLMPILVVAFIEFYQVVLPGFMEPDGDG